MARFAGFVLLLCGLACATTTTRVVQVRSVWSIDETTVAELEPGHFAGRWSNHAIDIWNPGQKDEETFVCIESGTFDGVWTEPAGDGVMKSCQLLSSKECEHPDGTQTFRFVETCKQGPEGFLVYEAKGSLVAATGRFEGMKARWTSTAWQVAPGPHDYGYTHGVVEVTMPRR